jgi:hypothetical protein
METRPVTFVPARSLRVARDVPVRTAALQHRAQVEAQLLDGRPAEKPLAVVDLVDTQTGFEHHRVRDHRIVRRIRVLRDVEILLHLASGIRKERPVRADALRNSFVSSRLSVETVTSRQ